jgi:soluble lytic murein transglycosylase-like protein
MRSLRPLLAVAILAIPASASADVRLAVKRDGTKYIYNVGGGGSGRSYSIDYNWLAAQRNRASSYDEIIHRHSRAYGVDPVLVKAVIQVESNFNPGVVSSKGARGLMQLMPATARRFGAKRVHDPEDNIRAGIAYLAVLQKMFPNDLQRVLAGYNAGENAVLRYGGIPPYEETQTYVKKALTVYYGRPHGGGGAVSFAGGSSKKGTLGGGFKAKTVASAAALAAVTSPIAVETKARVFSIR